jgi:hypothetical protein
MYTAAFIFSLYRSTSLAVHAIVSQVCILVIILRNSKLSYIYLVLSLPVALIYILHYSLKCV